jgi:transposase InsO family protein
MTTAEKVAHVAAVQADFGLAPALAALDLPRATWYHQQRHGRPYAERYADLRGPLEEIARAHPGYGYRRMTVELQQAYDRPVNHKVVQRLLKAWDLPMIRGLRRPRPSGVRQALQAAGERANLVAGLSIGRPGEVIYTDFTELVYANGQRKAQLIPLLDHLSKVVWGWAVGPQAVTALALQAWQAAWAQLRQWGLAQPGLIVHHDQDPVYTGYAWTGRLLLRDGVRLSFALHGARDNSEMEAFFSRFKEENQSLFLDAQTLPELCEAVADRMRYYNVQRRHSSIDYRPPLTYLERLLSSSELTIPAP